jgi:hypothetical protein
MGQKPKHSADSREDRSQPCVQLPRGLLGAREVRHTHLELYEPPPETLRAQSPSTPASRQARKWGERKSREEKELCLLGHPL